MAGARLRGDRIARLRLAAIAWIVLVLLVVAIDTFAGQRSGTFALIAVLEPYLVLSALLVAPLAAIGPTAASTVVVALLVVAVGVRYGPSVATGPLTEVDPNLSVTVWNVEAGNNAGERLIQGLDGVTSDLVGLQELQPPMADAAATNATLASAYPYRALYPHSSVRGVGLLSRYPILDDSAGQPVQSSTAPPFMRALVADSGGTTDRGLRRPSVAR